MLPNLRLWPITAAAVAGVALASSGIAWLLHIVIAEERSLGAAEHFILDLLIGAVVLLTLGWLVLRYRSRGQEQYQQEIDGARRKLDIAVSNMSHGLLLFDSSKRVVVANRRYIEMYGLSSDVVKPGCAIRDLLHHRQGRGSFFGDIDQYCADLDAELAQGKMTSLTTQIPGGRLIRVVNQPLSEGGWVATHDDITEQKNIEETLSQQKLQLDTALNNMSQGLNMFDAAGKLVLCNERYRDMYHLPTNVAKPGSSIRDLVNARIATGTFFSIDPEKYAANLLAAMDAKVPTIVLDAVG